jgi:hypothetical protein
MVRISFTLRVNQDNTVTVRRGRSVETFSMDGKTEYELVDVIRWSLISMGAKISWDEVHDMLLLEKKRKQ